MLQKLVVFKIILSEKMSVVYQRFNKAVILQYLVYNFKKNRIYVRSFLLLVGNFFSVKLQVWILFLQFQ